MLTFLGMTFIVKRLDTIQQKSVFVIYSLNKTQAYLAILRYFYCTYITLTSWQKNVKMKNKKVSRTSITINLIFSAFPDK